MGRVFGSPLLGLNFRLGLNAERGVVAEETFGVVEAEALGVEGKAILV